MASTSERNGNGVHTPPLPRRVGAVPHRTARGLYQLERYDLPGRGERWCILSGGIWLSVWPANGGDACGWTDSLAEADCSMSADDARRIVAWYESRLGSCSAPDGPAPRWDHVAPVIRFPIAEPSAPASLLYRVGGADWRLEERAAGGSWRARLGDRLLSASGDLVPLVPFAARADVEYSTAAAAQAAVDAHLAASSRPATAHRIRERLESFERLECDAALAPGPGGSLVVTFTPRSAAGRE